MPSFLFSRQKESRASTESFRIGGLVPIGNVESKISDSSSAHTSTSSSRSFHLDIEDKLAKSEKPIIKLPTRLRRSPAILEPSASVANPLNSVDDIVLSPAPSSPSTPFAELPGSILLQNQGFSHISPTKSRPLPKSLVPFFAEHANGTATTLSPLRDCPAEATVNGLPEFGHTSGTSKGKKPLRLDTELPSSHQCRSEQDNTTSPILASIRIKRRCSEPPISMVNREQSRRTIPPSPGTLQRLPCMSTLMEEWPVEERAHQFRTEAERLNNLKPLLIDQNRMISDLQASMWNMQTSHRQYVSSLNQTHAREMAMLRTYTEFLESQKITTKARRATLPTRWTSNKRSNQLPIAGRGVNQPSLQEGIENFQTRKCSSVCPSAAAHFGTASSAAVQTLQEARSESIPGTCPESQQLASQFCVCHTQIMNVESSGEQQIISSSSRSHACDTAFPQLVDLSRPRIELEHQFEALEANTKEISDTKLDVLAENHMYRVKYTKAHLEQRKLSEEIASLRSKLDGAATDTTSAKAAGAELTGTRPDQQLRATPDLGQFSTVIASQTEHITCLEAALKKSDSRIQQLEQECQAYRHDADEVKVRYVKLVNAYETLQITNRNLERKEDPNDQSTDQAAAALIKSGIQTNQRATSKRELPKVLQILSKQEETITELQKEREQISHLLHLEVRRQARSFADSDHLATSLDNYKSSRGEVDQAAARVRSKVQDVVLHSVDESSTRTDTLYRIEKLEKEIEYHVKDIVLYKMDVKGYKKDIKGANAKIEKLRQSLAEHHPASSRQTLDSDQLPTQSTLAKTHGSHDGPTTQRTSKTKSVPAIGNALLSRSATRHEKLPRRRLTPLLFDKTPEMKDTDASVADSIISSHASASVPLGNNFSEQGEDGNTGGEQMQLRSPAKSVLSRYSTFRQSEGGVAKLREPAV